MPVACRLSLVPCCPALVVQRLVLCLALLPSVAWAEAPRRGVSLGLFSEDAGWSYAPLLDEIAGLGATEVELVVPLYQEDVQATVVGYHPRYSPTLAAIRRTIREARARGLGVLLFPIVRLVATHGPNEWRGTLRPTDRAAWMASYGQRLVELAELARTERAEALSVGSELSTLDVDRSAWTPVVAAVRARYTGRLVYSGNWDHFAEVAIYDLVDEIGVCAYFPLAERAGAPLPALETLVAAWREPQRRLAAIAERIGRPVVLTELGYRSQPNALKEPWDEGAAVPVDGTALEAQRRGFAAFRAAFSARPAWLAGLYVWNWYGWGGASSRAYTPRGKPAEKEVRAILTP